MVEKNDREYYILKIIESSREPLGCGAISRKAREMGLDISEATTGRLLGYLDHKGYTEKKGYRGRILSPRGSSALKEYESNKQLEKSTNQFLRLIKAEDKEDLLQILVARRAIEKETSRLAAENVTDEGVAKLNAIIDKHLVKVKGGLSGCEEDAAFHKCIAQISGNKLLETALDLIRNEGQFSPVLEYIRKKVGSVIVSDHMMVMQAIADRNPREAEKKMTQHIENIINDVQKYWSIFYEDKEA